MNLPDCETCRRLLEYYRVPPHIVAHSRQVAAIGVALGEALAETGLRFDRQLLLSSGLLHDIAKMASLEKGCDHAELGAQWLRQAGYPEVAEIVGSHIRLPAASPAVSGKGPLGARELVFYADKRVRHDEIVSLDERLEDLRNRYGNRSFSRNWLQDLKHLVFSLERRIFAVLPFGPEAVADLAAAVKIC